VSLIIAKISQWLGVISLVGIPIAVATTHFFDKEQEAPAIQRVAYDATATVIFGDGSQSDNPFWTHFKLKKYCNNGDYLYVYNGHTYAGNGKNGVHMLTDDVDIASLCPIK
jgi:hypothetical protein